MTQNIKNFIEEGELELVQKINELEPSGFNIDSPYSDNGYYLDEDKTKEWYRSRQISLIKMIVERMKEEIWAYHKLNNEWLKKYNVSEELEKELNEMFMHSHNEPLDTISSKLKELTDGK